MSEKDLALVEYVGALIAADQKRGIKRTGDIIAEFTTQGFPHRDVAPNREKLTQAFSKKCFARAYAMGLGFLDSRVAMLTLGLEEPELSREFLNIQPFQLQRIVQQLRESLRIEGEL